MKYTETEIAALIYEALTKQRFADWYEKVFVPHIQDSQFTTKEKIMEDIAKVFQIK